MEMFDDPRVIAVIIGFGFAVAIGGFFGSWVGHRLHLRWVCKNNFVKEYRIYLRNLTMVQLMEEIYRIR